MGRKVDAQMLKLKNEVKMIQANLEGTIQAQEAIIKRHNDSLIQMRDLLNKLIEG